MSRLLTFFLAFNQSKVKKFQPNMLKQQLAQNVTAG